MKRHLPLYAIALAILAVGLIAAGVPASTLLVLGLALACPLMMVFMHGGHGGHGGAPPAARPGNDPDETTPRPGTTGHRHAH